MTSTAPSTQPSDESGQAQQPVADGTRVTYDGSKEAYRGLSGQVVRSYGLESGERRYDLYLDLPEGGNQIVARARRASFAVQPGPDAEAGA